MKGFIFALLAGAFITLQGVINARVSQDIGTWQTATVTQFSGFIVTLLILLFVRKANWKKLKLVQPLYLTGGAFGAIVIFSNVTAIHFIGVTLSIAAILIAQLSLTFIIDGKGWFGVAKQRMQLPQFIGIGLMIIGVIILKL